MIDNNDMEIIIPNKKKKTKSLNLIVYQKLIHKSKSWKISEISRAFLLIRIAIAIIFGILFGILNISSILGLVIFAFCFLIIPTKFLEYYINLNIFQALEDPLSILKQNLFIVYLIFLLFWFLTNYLKDKLLHSS